MSAVSESSCGTWTARSWIPSPCGTSPSATAAGSGAGPSPPSRSRALRGRPLRAPASSSPRPAPRPRPRIPPPPRSSSASAAIEHVKRRGGKRISLVSLVSAPDGVEKVMADHPEVNIFTAVHDSHLNDHGYIVPGLGDAGDRLFGTK